MTAKSTAMYREDKLETLRISSWSYIKSGCSAVRGLVNTDRFPGLNALHSTVTSDPAFNSWCLELLTDLFTIAPLILLRPTMDQSGCNMRCRSTLPALYTCIDIYIDGTVGNFKVKSHERLPPFDHESKSSKHTGLVQTMICSLWFFFS